MKKNGFTLVELIGVLVILGLIATFSVPALTKTMKDSSEKQYNEYLKNITLAAENYFHSETDGTLNGKYFIKIKTLYDSGYLKKEKNPKTNEDTNENSTVMISKNEDGTEKYELLDMDATETGYVSDGLLVHYDGYHKPENNVWNDLSGNGNNGTLYNFSENAFNNNGIYFDGVSNYISIKEINTESITYDVIFKGNYLENHSSILTNVEAGGCRIGILKGQYKIFGQCYIDGSYRTVTTPIKDNTNIYSATLTYGQSSLKLYINGQLIGTYNDTSKKGITYPLSNTYMMLGTNPSGNKSSDIEMYNGNIYSARIYNRALTDEEIKNNYNVDKYRFDV